MPQLLNNGTPRWDLPPYTDQYGCPKCGAGFKILPGDRFEVFDYSEGEEIAGGLKTECPGCRTLVEIPIDNPDQMVGCSVIMSLEEATYLRRLDNRVRYIDQIISVCNEQQEQLEWTEMAIDEIRALIKDRMPPQSSIRREYENAPPQQEEYREERRERRRPGPESRDSRHDEPPSRPRRPTRPTGLRGNGADDDDPLYSGSDPRGNYDPRVEEEIIPSQLGVSAGGRGGRGPNSEPISFGDDRE